MSEHPCAPAGFVLLTVEEYVQLVESASSADMMITCEICGAWLYRDDPFCAVVNDFRGCWKMATLNERYANDCRSYRAPDKMP